MNKKLTGSFYTPDFLSKFIIRHASSAFNNFDKLSILEPSVGDGSFVEAFNSTTFSPQIKRYSFTAIDKVKPELKKAEKTAFINRKKNTTYSFTKSDFLKFQKSCRKKFQFIVGNPPYIKKQLLTTAQKELCRQIHESANLSQASIKNIWSAFLVQCSRMLSSDGVIAFVLPSELLQVNFSSELRSFLIANFQRIEIFTFDDLLFECKGQDTVILFGFKQHPQPGQFYSHIVDSSQLQNDEFILTSNQALITTETKWTHHFLSSDELSFIHKIGKQLKTVSDYCDSKPGIVTAANTFFIVNQETEFKYDLSRFTKPIIQKGLYVNGSVVFNQKDFTALTKKGKATKILSLNDDDAHNMPLGLRRYLQVGADLKIPDRYKCQQRNKWFVIPNISTPPDGFFFKRSHYYPKLLKNEADIFVTDSAYKIKMLDHASINDLIYSFYNSLTLTFAELDGRYYGGGVLEMTPKEFKKLPIPFIHINDRDFESFVKDFENKNQILDILEQNDFVILNKTLGLNTEEINQLRIIYTKLISKRFRIKS